MVNIPHRSSESLMAEAIALRTDAIRRTVTAIVGALLAAILIGALLQARPADTNPLHDLVPLDDPAVSWLFTA
jgi:hypothetical protein